MLTFWDIVGGLVSFGFLFTPAYPMICIWYLVRAIRHAVKDEPWEREAIISGIAAAWVFIMLLYFVMRIP